MQSFEFPIRYLRRLAVMSAAVSAIVLMSACTGPPVQEMSDARQAISAAQDAGADTLATESFREAKSLLLEAERAIRNASYYAARVAAVEAKAKALEAMRAANPNAENTERLP